MCCNSSRLSTGCWKMEFFKYGHKKKSHDLKGIGVFRLIGNPLVKKFSY
jgi:hypothetical protein